MFQIKVANLRWLDEIDESEDRCLHGDAWVQIGEEILEFENATVSASAFYLLRSLIRCDSERPRPIQYLPCCGFDVYMWQGEVVILGCPTGVDWLVYHEDNKIRLITESGHETVIPFEDYRKAVCAFADEIEAFYRNSKEKVYLDSEQAETYAALWQEWRTIRNQYS